MLSRTLRTWLIATATPALFPRLLLLLDFSIFMFCMINNIESSGYFFVFNSGFPCLLLLSFALEGMELFPDVKRFSAANDSKIVRSVRDYFFDDINTSQCLGLYVILMQVRWNLGAGDFGCYDGDIMWPGDAAKQAEYEALDECAVTADLFLAVVNCLFLGLLTISLVWRAKDVCVFVWLITLVTFIFDLRTNSNGLSGRTEEQGGAKRDLAVGLFQMGPILCCLVTCIFGILPSL